MRKVNQNAIHFCSRIVMGLEWDCNVKLFYLDIVDGIRILYVKNSNSTN